MTKFLNCVRKTSLLLLTLSTFINPQRVISFNLDTGDKRPAMNFIMINLFIKAFTQIQFEEFLKKKKKDFLSDFIKRIRIKRKLRK